MDGVYKDPFGRLFYNTKKKVAEWTVDVEFREHNLTTEQSALARKIVNENKEHTLWEILDALAHAGFRGEILHLENIPHWNDSKIWGARITSAPTLAQAHKWLREAKGIAINVIAHGRCDCRDGKYHWEEVYLPNCKENGLQWADWFIYGKHPLFDTYEQALSDGLSQMLNLINKNVNEKEL